MFFTGFLRGTWGYLENKHKLIFLSTFEESQYITKDSESFTLIGQTHMNRSREDDLLSMQGKGGSLDQTEQKTHVSEIIQAPGTVMFLLI